MRVWGARMTPPPAWATATTCSPVSTVPAPTAMRPANAPAMAAMPVLLIHAREDREVPADTGDLLYERLGRPERWEYDGGHSWVFLILPRLKGEIARWLEGAAGAAPAE